MNQPLRIAHIVHSLGAGGMENGVVNIIRALQGSDFQFSVICLTRSGAFRERLPKGTPVLELNKPPGLSPTVSLRMARAIARNGTTTLHTHNLAALIYGVPAGLLARCGQILHGEHAQLSPAELTPRRLAIRRFLYRFTARVHTVSHGQKLELEHLGFPPQNIEAVINGVDTGRFHPGDDRSAARARFGILPDATVLGMVGRFGEFKRHQALIEAFETLASQHPNLVLLMPGGGGPMEKVTRDRVASSPFAARMILPGFMADPLPAYQAMDLLVVPSLNEGLSNAALEAMASGVPVLAHHACGAAELLGGESGGWVCDLSSTQLLSESLGRLLGDPHAITTMSATALERVKDGYSINSMIRHYRRLYTEVAQSLPKF